MNIRINPNDYKGMDSFLKTLVALALPLDIVDAIMNILRESLINCDSERLQLTLKCLDYMQDYKNAMIAAGVK